MDNHTVRHRGPPRQKDTINFPTYLANYWDVLKTDFAASSSRSFLYSFIKEKMPSLSEMQLLNRAHSFIYDIETGRRSTDCLTINMLMKHCEKDRVLANDLLYSEHKGIDQDAVTQLMKIDSDFICPLLIDMNYPVSLFLRKKGDRILYIVVSIDIIDIFNVAFTRSDYQTEDLFITVSDNFNDALECFHGLIDDYREALEDPNGFNAIDPSATIPTKLEKYFVRKAQKKPALSDRTAKNTSPSSKRGFRSQI